VGRATVLPHALYELEVGVDVLAGPDFGALEEHVTTIAHHTQSGCKHQ